MARHDRRNPRGQFTKVRPEADLAPENVSGAPSPNTIEHPRYAPGADDLAQAGNMRLVSRTPIEIDAQTGGSLGAHITDVRAADVYVGGARTQAHTRAACDDDFASYLLGASGDNRGQVPESGPRSMKNLPPTGHTDEAPDSTVTGVDNSRGLYR